MPENTKPVVITDKERKAACEALSVKAEDYFIKLMQENLLCELAKKKLLFEYTMERTNPEVCEKNGYKSLEQADKCNLVVAKGLSQLNAINELIRINQGVIPKEAYIAFEALKKFENSNQAILSMSANLIVKSKNKNDINFDKKMMAFNQQLEDLGKKENAITRVTDALGDFKSGSLSDMQAIAETLNANKKDLETRRPGPAKVFWDIVESFLTKYKFGEPSVKFGIDGANFTQFADKKMKSVGIEIDKPVSKMKPE